MIHVYMVLISNPVGEVTIQMKLLQWYFHRALFISCVFCGSKGVNIQMKPFDCPFPFLPVLFQGATIFSTCYKWIFSILVSLEYTKERVRGG